MDWVGEAARWLREMLAHPWLDVWQSTIARTPDWALLTAALTSLLLFVFMLRLMWPRSHRPSRVETETTAQPTSASMQSQQKSALVHVVPKPAAKPAAPAFQTTGPPEPNSAADDNEDRVVRVFISSTFIDMEGEREVLVKETFPALRAIFRARGAEFLAIDLRWGVTEEDVRAGNTLAICLREVDRCEPYFLGLLGERYGSLLTPDILTPERIADFPVLEDSAGRSLTEIEVMQGVLRKPKTANRALFFQRDPAWLETLSAAEREKYQTSDDDDRAKLAELKIRIRDSGAQIIGYARPADIGAVVESALSQLIDAQFPDTDAPTPFELTMRLHRAYARERRGLHVGAAHYLAALGHWMDKRDAPPLLITGESGGGKSTLIANWLHAWRTNRPGDIVFEHYLGASPDSSDPSGIIRRLWEQLNRDTGENVELPASDVELMDFSAELAQRLAQANAFAERNGARILIALDGFDKLSSGRDLRWLPLVPGVKIVASSIAGETKSAALKREWTALEVKPLSAPERGEFIKRTLEGWGRKLAREQTTALLLHALAGNPLFLKTVLDELRVSASNASLNDCLTDYLGATSLSDLFGRVLARVEDDCEPGLVAKALPLIWASRAGLEETEIIAITDTKPLFWATLRNSLGDGLRDQSGRLAFSHDYLNQAVETRYLNGDEAKCGAHLAIATRFEAREADQRQAEELPYQLNAAKAWDRLEALLTDLERFKLLRTRGDSELWSHWLPLKKRGRDPEALLCASFDESVRQEAEWTQTDIDLAFELTAFLRFTGATGGAFQRLCERLSAACERILGPQHPDTLSGINNLALTLHARGDLEGALRYQQLALETRTRVLGPEHPDTLTGMGNLASTLYARGDLEGAQRYQQLALERSARVLGAEHPRTLSGINNLALTLHARGDLEGALRYQQLALETRTRVLGPEHPDTLTGMGNLASTLYARGDLEGAQRYQEQVLEARTRILGPDHPDTLTSMSNLAGTLHARGDLEGAQRHQQWVLETETRILGPEHPDTLTSMSNLAGTLHARGDLEGAQRYRQLALETRTRVLGPEHPDTLTSMSNLAGTLHARGDLEGAQRYQEQVLEARKRILGPDHPDTLTSMSNLAGTLHARGDLEGAQRHQQWVLETETRILGPEHPDTLSSMNNLGTTLYARGDLEGAQRYLERSLETRTRILGPEHSSTLTSMLNLSRVLKARGNLEGALQLSERALVLATRRFGGYHPLSQNASRSVAGIEEEIKRRPKR